jgi:hypothetical protein
MHLPVDDDASTEGDSIISISLLVAQRCNLMVFKHLLTVASSELQNNI